MNSSAELKWLVKSDGKVLGPYSYDQILELLKLKQISILDEVRDMETRWLYIRESEALQDIVNEVRADLANNEEFTQTFQTRSVGGLTQTTTTELESNQVSVHNFTNVSVAETVDVEFKETLTYKKPNVPKAQTSQYGSVSDPFVKSQIKNDFKKNMLYLGVLSIVLLVSLGGFWFYKSQAQKKVEQTTLAQIRRYNLYGIHNKVIELFGTLNPRLQKQILSDIIPMIPRLDAAGLINGPSTIANLKSYGALSEQKKAMLELVEFNQAMQDQDLKKARESILRATDLDPSSETVKENSAILLFNENEFKSSKEQFYALYRAQQKGRLLLGFALSHFMLNEQDLAQDQVVIDEISRYTTTKVDFRKELLLVSMYLNLKIGKQTAFLDSLNDFLKTPVGLKRMFLQPPLIFSDFYSMQTTKKVFDQLKVLLNSLQKLFVEVHLKIETGEISAAKNLFDTYKNIIENTDDKINLNIQIDLALKNYDAVIAAEKTIDKTHTNMATDYALLIAKKTNGLPINEFQPQVSKLESYKNILSLWADFLTLEGRQKQLSFVQLNSGMGEDFIPFLEVKGQTD